MHLPCFCRIHELFFKLDELQDLQATSGSSGQAHISKAPINQVVRMPPQMDKRLLALEEQVSYFYGRVVILKIFIEIKTIHFKYISWNVKQKMARSSASEVFVVCHLSHSWPNIPTLSSTGWMSWVCQKYFNN